MQAGVETEGTRRKEDDKNLQDKMVLKMEEGFKKEQQARQLVQHEIAQGFKNEESARHLVPKELAIMNDEIKTIENGQWQYGLQ